MTDCVAFKPGCTGCGPELHEPWRVEAVDDDLLETGFGPKRARRWKTRGENNPGQVGGFASYFRKAQKKVERKHFRDRKVLMYYEKERKKLQRQMGQDPYLDTPG